MGIFGRAKELPLPPAPAVVKDMSNLTKFGLVAVLALVGALIAASWAGAFKATPSTHSVTVTAPKAPPVVPPKVDGTTQTELAVLASGAGWDSGAKTAALWLADRLLWPGFLGLVIAAILYALPFVPNEWAWRMGMGCVVLMVIGIVAPLAADFVSAVMTARNAAVVNGLPPAAGR